MARKSELFSFTELCVYIGSLVSKGDLFQDLPPKTPQMADKGIQIPYGDVGGSADGLPVPPMSFKHQSQLLL